MMLLFLENTGSAAMDVGVMFLKIVALFYFVISIKLVADGALRGAEAMKYFMLSTFTDLILRVILAYILSGWLSSSTGIWLSWPIGWSVATVLSVVFYRKVVKKAMEV